MYLTVERCIRCGDETAAAGCCQACKMMDLAASTLAATFAQRARKELPSRGPFLKASLTAFVAAGCTFTLAIGAWFQ
jgi:hypothetical protein